MKSNARDLIGAPPPTRFDEDRRKPSRRKGKHKTTLEKLLSEAE